MCKSNQTWNVDWEKHLTFEMLWIKQELMDFAPLFWFPLMFSESLRLCSIKVSVYIPLPFILHIFPTEAECHIDLISFDCGGGSWVFYGNFKNSRIDQSNSRSQRKQWNNQSDGVMLDEHWSTVDCLPVISMAPVDLPAHSDRSIEKRRGRRRRARCLLKKLSWRGCRQAIKLVDNRDGSKQEQVSHLSIASLTGEGICDPSPELCTHFLTRALGGNTKRSITEH